MSQRKADLYTARWHILKGLPVPMDGPREAVLDVLRPLLGPEPGFSDPATTDNNADDMEPGEVRISSPIYDQWLYDEDSGFPIVGQSLFPDQLPDYLDTLSPADFRWTPSRICIHHTAAPSLRQRPAGFVQQHMRNLCDYYKETRGWGRGPHLFVDDDEVWLFTPLTMPGIHAASFNRDAIGIEMLGDYDNEDPKTGRGRSVIETTARAVVHLMAHFDIGEDAILFHRDDPQTDKTCPGSQIAKPWFLDRVREQINP